ncbi:hypothetical protein TNCV_4945451 [Trichonephila clavipes]|nr:hypothetical protein TNCV_4945451 [Trichonephila clavipes]
MWAIPQRYCNRWIQEKMIDQRYWLYQPRRIATRDDRVKWERKILSGCLEDSERHSIQGGKLQIASYIEV